MAESPKTFSTDAPALTVGKWIGRVMVAVLLGEGIWGLIVSLTNNLLLPFLAKTMGADAQSPLYLGKGDFNFPAVFMSVLELCFAGIVSVVLYSWVQRKPRAIRSKPAKTSLIPEQPSVAPASPPPVAQIQKPAPTPSPVAQVPQPASPPVASAPEQFWSPPQPSTPTPTPSAEPTKVKPVKPKAPKEVYYNIVGEPLSPEDDN
jgi:hypothetical protein